MSESCENVYRPLPYRCKPQNQMSAHVHEQLCKKELNNNDCHDREGNRLTRRVFIEEDILQSVEKEPNFGAHGIARWFSLTVWRIQNEKHFYSFSIVYEHAQTFDAKICIVLCCIRYIFSQLFDRFTLLHCKIRCTSHIHLVYACYF